MKTAEGLVIEATGNIAKIKTGRHNECKNCGACPGDNSVIVCAKNQKGAMPGQRVVFEVKETNALMAAFIVFILPLVVVFVGAMIGEFIGQEVGSFNSGFEIIGGLIGFILALGYIKFFDKSLKGKEKSQPSILRIL